MYDADTGNMLADVATKYLGKVQHNNILQQIKEFSRRGLQAKDGTTAGSTATVRQSEHLLGPSGSHCGRRCRKLGFSSLTSTLLRLDDYNREIGIYEG